MNDAPLYRSTGQALSASYRAESRAPIKLSSVLSDMRGSTASRRSEMTPLDWVAQAGLIISATRRTLDPVHRRHLVAVEAYYLVPTGAYEEARKEVLCQLLGNMLRVERPDRSRWWMTDVVRRWARDVSTHHTDEWWARHLNVHPDTLRRWRSRPGRRPSVEGVLNGWLSRAEALVDARLREAGIVGEP